MRGSVCTKNASVSFFANDTIRENELLKRDYRNTTGLSNTHPQNCITQSGGFAKKQRENIGFITTLF